MSVVMFGGGRTPAMADVNSLSAKSVLAGEKLVARYSVST